MFDNAAVATADVAADADADAAAAADAFTFTAVAAARRPINPTATADPIENMITNFTQSKH